MIQVGFIVYVSEWNNYKDWIQSLGYKRPTQSSIGDQWVSANVDKETALIISMKYHDVVIGEMI
jgi:hypothetical protein